MLRLIGPVRPDDLRQPGIGGGEFDVGSRERRVDRARVEIIGAAKVILCAGAADRRPLVAVEKELDLALAPPAGIVDAPGHISSDVMPAPANAVEHDIVLFERQRVRATKPCVEIGCVLGNVSQCIVDLPVDDRFCFGIAVFEGEPGAAAERHFPIAVERAPRIDADGKRAHLGVAAPSAGEKISERRLHRRLVLIVPVDAQDEIAPAHVRRRDPHLLDRSGALDVAEPKRLARRDAFRGRDFPAAPKAAGVNGAGSFDSHAARALLARRILRADRARFPGR